MSLTAPSRAADARPQGSNRFTRFARAAAAASGKPAAFIGAVLVIVMWALAGPVCHFNDTWQLTINTGTTIVTFLMVFVIQNSQNRDTSALQIKLDELIHVIAAADNRLLDLEELDDDVLSDKQREFEQIAETARDVAPDEGQLSGS